MTEHLTSESDFRLSEIRILSGTRINEIGQIFRKTQISSYCRSHRWFATPQQLIVHDERI